MNRAATVLVALSAIGLVLAGCSAPAAPAGLDKQLGDRLVGKGGDRGVRGVVLEGDFGAGWSLQPNTTIDAPRIDNTNKDVSTPGGGSKLTLTRPAAEKSLKVRFSGLDAGDLQVSWGMFPENGTQGTWSDAKPASEPVTLQITSAGATKIVARFTDSTGLSAVGVDPMIASIYVRYTIDSVVWPFAPSASPPSRCHFQEPVFACVGGWNMVCTWGSAGSACVDAGFGYAGVFVCIQDPVCTGYGVPVPVDPPAVPRPPNYDEMADEYAFDVPLKSHVSIETQYRQGSWMPPNGDDVDLELALGAQEGMCAGDGGNDETLPFSAEHAHEALQQYISPGTWKARVGGVSCPWFSYQNPGAVPYTVTILVEYGKVPPPCPTGGGPDGGVETQTAKPTSSAAQAFAPVDPPEKPMPPDLPGGGCGGGPHPRPM